MDNKEQIIESAIDILKNRYLKEPIERDDIIAYKSYLDRCIRKEMIRLLEQELGKLSSCYWTAIRRKTESDKKYEESNVFIKSLYEEVPGHEDYIFVKMNSVYELKTLRLKDIENSIESGTRSRVDGNPVMCFVWFGDKPTESFFKQTESKEKVSQEPTILMGENGIML